MRKIVPTLLLCLTASLIVHANNKQQEFSFTGISSFTPTNSLTLWYDEPATVAEVSNIWMEYSLPIGNGQLGACLFGGICRDEIQFNEKTLWTGSPNDIGSYGQYKNFGSIFVDDVSGNIGYEPSNAAKDYVRYLKGSSVVRANSDKDIARDYYGALRIVITTKYLTEGEHWLRFKNVNENDDGSAQFMHDYFEIVPMTFIRNEELSLEEKRK